MEYIDSWVFNRGQEITLRRGPKMYHASIQLFHRDKYPVVWLRDKNKERILLRALKLLKEDVNKDGQMLILLDDYHDHGTNKTPFPLAVRSESMRWPKRGRSRELHAEVLLPVRNELIKETREKMEKLE